jgi:hypothetical protein
MMNSDTEIAARCPKCGMPMALAVAAPHAVASVMQKHTYLCFPCNQVKIYMRPAK